MGCSSSTPAGSPTNPASAASVAASQAPAGVSGTPAEVAGAPAVESPAPRLANSSTPAATGSTPRTGSAAGDAEAPGPGFDAFEGVLKDGNTDVLVHVSVLLRFGPSIVAAEPCVTLVAPTASNAFELLSGLLETQLVYEADVVTDAAKAWSGTVDATGTLLRMQHAASGMILEMQKQPFRHHLAIVGHEETGGLRRALGSHINKLCNPARQLRIWTNRLENSRASRAQAIQQSANFAVLLSPGVWESEEVMEDIRLADKLGRTVLLLYKPAEVVHVRTAVIEFKELEACPAIKLGDIINSAPADLQKLFDFMEAIPLRLQPYMEAAVLRHVAALAGCSASLTVDQAVDFSISQVPEYLDAADAAAASAPADSPQEQQHWYYEGVAIKPPAKADAPRERSHRGWFQVEADFKPAERRVLLTVQYEPNSNASMPQYCRKLQLSWDPSSGQVEEDEQAAGVDPRPEGSHWARWHGSLLAGQGSFMRLSEGADEILLRPMPFMTHFYLVGVKAEVAALGASLTSLLSDNASPGRRPRSAVRFGGSRQEREAAVAQCKVLLLFLSPSLWHDPGCMEDLALARQLGKQVVLVQDPDPRMPSHVDVATCCANAPSEHCSLFSERDVYPMYRRWYEQEAFITHIFEVAGLVESIKHPYQQSGDAFEAASQQQRSDINELAGLRAGLWRLYEGVAERRWGADPGCIWGWYHCDVKFRPAAGEVEMLLQFETGHPDSIPSYNACFVLTWEQSVDGAAAGAAAAAADEKLHMGVAKGATPPPPGDWVVMKEATPRWRGSLVGGIGGTFHLINNYGDNLTFTPRPFVWHFFLSHIQRESSDLCGLLVARMHKHCLSGKLVRLWYDNKVRCHTVRLPSVRGARHSEGTAGAIVNKEAMELGVQCSCNFVLVLTPSVFRSPYVKFEILSAHKQNKTIILLYDPTPGLKSSINVEELRAEASEDLQFLFRSSDDSSSAAGPVHMIAFPAGGDDAAHADSIKALLDAGGFSDYYLG